MSTTLFTGLERAILDWILHENPDPALTFQINAATVIKREYTGVGWFIDLQVLEPTTRLGAKLESPIQGPFIRSPQIEHDGGSLLFHKNGVITMLEMYSNGSQFARDLIHYELFRG